VITNIGASVTQRITYAWDFISSGAWQRLRYQSFAPVVAADTRLDRSRELRAGLGYHIGQTMRVGIDVLYDTRDSVIAARRYHTLRLGASLTYGIRQ
jgi:hypothetical protein